MDNIRFQLDEHVPDAVAHALRLRGINVVTASEACLLGASDTQVFDSASAAGRVLVTNDSDFLRLHYQKYGTPVSPTASKALELSAKSWLTSS